MKTGRIPENVFAVMLPKQTLKGSGTPRQHWSFGKPQNLTAGFDEYDASSAFVVPADSDMMVGSARTWALRFCKGYDEQTVPNTPFVDLRWVGIDSRMEGGVAYKVVTPQGWLVDLREDVLLECLHAGAIERKNGHAGEGTYLTAEFVWVQLGSQSRLAMVGSELHRELMEATTRKGMENIPQSDIVAGGVYMNRAGKQWLVLGKEDKFGFLLMEIRDDKYDKYRNESSAEQFAAQARALNMADCIPRFHYTKKLTVVQKVGDVAVPGDIVSRYEKRLVQLRNKGWA